MRTSAARTVCLAAAPALVTAGVGGWALVSRQLADERIMVHRRSRLLAGHPVAGPFTAFAQASAIKKNALAIGGGRTFAEISEELYLAEKHGDQAHIEELAETRRNRLHADLLRATLLTSVLAFGVSALAGGVGVLAGVVGSALPKE